MVIVSSNMHNPLPAFPDEISYSNAESLAFPENYNIRFKRNEIL
jgi:hypothetical protein